MLHCHVSPGFGVSVRSVLNGTLNSAYQWPGTVDVAACQSICSMISLVKFQGRMSR